MIFKKIALLLPLIPTVVFALQAPVAVNDFVRVVEGSTNTLDYLHLNDTDLDGDALKMVPTNGVEIISSMGFAGTTGLTYVVTDGSLFSTGTVTVAINEPIDAEAARDQLLAGVSTIASGSQPGRLAVFGPTAYAVNFFEGESEMDPMIGISSYGHGKVVALPDHQMLDVSRWTSSNDSGAFAINALAWLAGTTDRNISIVTYSSSARDWFEAEGFNNIVLSSESALMNDLIGADVFFGGWMGSSEPEANLVALGEFAEAGGGLFINDYGNGYEDFWWNNLTRPEAPSNVLLRKAGIGFSDDGYWLAGDITATNRSSLQIHSETALAMLDDSTGYSSDELTQAFELLFRMGQVLPPEDVFHARKSLGLMARVALINPTPTTPVSDPAEQALLNMESDLLAKTPPDEVVAHRTAEATYGTISTNAPRVTDSVTINASRTRWQATGFYAAPGELVEVIVPPELVGLGYRVRINAHTDNIGQRSSWERFPNVHRWFEINSTTTQVANAFGGSIFIDLRGDKFDENPPNHGPIEVTVSNALRQPWFDLDQHTDADWNTIWRDQPGNYAVLVSSNHVLCLPKQQVESVNLSEPTRLMRWWDSVVTSEDWLAGYLNPRTGAELANVDVQISAGTAHSGYPFQAYQKYWGNLADIDDLALHGSWGDFHELGHNHQRSWWKFDGDGEVTVNVFSTYCLRTLASSPDPGGWGWVADPVAVIQRATAAAQSSNYLDITDSFADRLSFWIQLADGFGWETYHQVLSSYEDDNVNNPSALPSNDQEDMEQWLVRWSNQVGYNLSGFMVDTWGFPIGDEVISQIEHLPDWMPIIGEMPEVSIPVNKAHLLDFNTYTYSMDGTADVVSLSAPAHGQLVDHGDGNWIYEPDYNFTGTDTFVYTLQSSAGNTASFTNTISISGQGAFKETWLNISGGYNSSLTDHVRYPDDPDEQSVVDSLQMPSNMGGDYGVRIRALLLPPVTGDYTFWIASDDNSRLKLSSNENPAGVVEVAEVNGWTDPLDWDQDPSQQSDPISLVAGQKYYMDITHKEGGGGDHLAIAWQIPGSAETNIITMAYLELPPGLYTEVDNARSWAGQNGLSGDDLNVDADPDNDGHTNQQEFDARTNPNDAASILRLDIDSPSLGFNAVSGKTYRVEYRNGFGDTNGWKSLSEFTATQEVIEVIDPGTSNQPVRIYRVRVNPY